MDTQQQIARSKAFLKRLWALENDERPGFMIGYVGPRVKNGKPIPSALFSSEGPDTVRDRILDPAKFLRAQLNEIEAQLALKGDFVPSLCPTLGLVGIPSAFGCEVVWWENDLPAVRPVFAEGVDEITPLPMPIVRDGQLGRMLDYTRYFIEETGGRYPIRMSDIQGPIDSTALILGHNNFLMAMYTNPAAVHRLLQQVTDLTIAFVRAQREIAYSLGCEFIPSMFQPWIPDGLGISVSNDECVMMSAQMHDEFNVPYLNQLSEAFGGIYVHSCGKWTHQFPSLAKIRNLRGHEFGASEATFEPVLKHFGGKIVLACRVGLHRDLKFRGMNDFVRRVKTAAATYRGLFINVDITNGLVDENWPEADLEEIYRLIETA
jgi:uroporphyrinogen decarboxylase-like protein